MNPQSESGGSGGPCFSPGFNDLFLFLFRRIAIDSPIGFYISKAWQGSRCIFLQMEPAVCQRFILPPTFGPISLWHPVAKSCLLKCKGEGSNMVQHGSTLLNGLEIWSNGENFAFGMPFGLGVAACPPKCHHIMYCLRLSGFRFQLLSLVLLLIQKNVTHDSHMLGRAHTSHKPLNQKLVYFPAHHWFSSGRLEASKASAVGSWHEYESNCFSCLNWFVALHSLALLLKPQLLAT